MNLIFIDTETTGLNPKKHEIIELAFAVEIDGVIYCKMDLFMRPEKWDTISEKALAVNGWTIERLRRLPEKERGWTALINYMVREASYFKRKFMVVEHSRNGIFDCRFLKAFWDNSNFDAFFPYGKFFSPKAINTRDIAKKKLPDLKSYRLFEIDKALRIPVDEGKLHGAAYDRDLLIDVYDRLNNRAPRR